MQDEALIKKLRIKPGQEILIYNAPAGFYERVAPLANGYLPQQEPGGQAAAFDVAVLFVHHTGELASLGGAVIKALKADGILWIAYPKLSSRIKSDLTRDEGWAFLDPYQLTGVSNISIDDTWTAIRFKHAEDGLTHGQRMAEYKQQLKRPQERTINIPDDLNAALLQNPEARSVFEKFAYTHRKEYVNWIESAKKADTRERRISQAVEMLKSGKKIS